MKPKLWQVKKAIARRYQRAITRLIQGLLSELKKLDGPFSVADAIRRIARSPTFITKAYEIARSMVTQIFVANAKSWRQAAAIGSRAKEIYNLLKSETEKSTRFQEIVKQNAQYISSIPQTMAEAVTKIAAESYGQGKRPQEVMKEILDMCPGISQSRAKLIARTETSKASTALTRSRAERLRLDWYVWRNSEDERVRSSHDHMGGVLVNWNDPPSPEALDPAKRQKPYGKYHAGDTFNCRCYPEPLLNTADVSWPARVYHNGKIRTMSLAKFKALNGGT